MTTATTSSTPRAAGDLDDVAARERWYLAEGWWTGDTLPGYVLRHCRTDPAALAVTGPSGQLTRGELAAQTDATAASFRKLGVRHGERVLVQLPNEPELIVVVLALAQIGAAAVLAVPGLRERELRHVTDTARACAIVVSERAQRGANLAVARVLAASCPSVRHLIVSGDAAPGEIALRDLAAGPPAPESDQDPDPSDVALYLLSGGTTGLPKLIPRTHRDYVCNLTVSIAAAGLDAGTVYLAALPVSHNFALGCPGVLGALAAGGRVVFADARLIDATLELMAAERVTIAAAVPGLAVRWSERARERSGTGLSVLQVGGARLHGTHAQELTLTLGCTVQQVYGMAEGLLCFTRLDDRPDVIEWTQGRPASPGDQYRLVDETGTDVPPGEPGELWVRGPYTIPGYLASQEVNDASFAPGGWYRTGDIIAPHPSGNLVVEGRSKDFINTDGEKVSAEEVEELIETHPLVAQAAVVAAPSELTGEDVCVYVVWRGDGESELTLSELRGYLTRQGMARYKLPGRLRVVTELPVTAVGKVDKAALRIQELRIQELRKREET